MKTHVTGICPLCGRFFSRIDLLAPILAEWPPVRHGTIKEIKARYPGWVHADSACQGCWEFFRERVVRPTPPANFISLG